MASSTEDQEPKLEDIEDLSAGDIDRLSRAGFDTLSSVALALPEELMSSVDGMGEAEAKRICEKATKLYFDTATQQTAPITHRWMHQSSQMLANYYGEEKLEDIEGLSVANIDRLRRAGFNTLSSVAFALPRELMSSIKGLGEAEAKHFCEKATKFYFDTATLSPGSSSSTVRRISTGSTALDSMLGGGIEPGSIIELFGAFRTGKTQLCHPLAVTCQLGDDDGKCIFIDTKGTFRPERIISIACRYGLTPTTTATDNIVYVRAYNTDHQIRLMEEAGRLIASSRRYKLVVVDSATSLYRTEFYGPGELHARQRKMETFMTMLKRLATDFRVAVVVTNEVVTAVDAPVPTELPVGGQVMARASKTRLHLVMARRQQQRICRLYNRPFGGAVLIGIYEDGIGDAY